MIEHCSIASTTADSEGLLHLVLCQVILGNMEEVVLGSKQRQPSSEEFDSGVDKLNGPKNYIIWPAHLETHISPIFILSLRLDLQSRSKYYIYTTENRIMDHHSPTTIIVILIS